jgi:TRAP-type C4-dicarboxylate transport system permease small subunit
VGVLRWLERLEVVVARIGKGTTAVAGWLYLAGAVFVTFNVFSRRFLGFSSPGVVEVTGYLLAAGISLGLAETLTTRGHIRVDVLVRSFPIGIRVYMHTIALAFLTGFGALLAVRSADVVTTSWELGSRDTTELETPLFVPEGIWLAGIVLFSLLLVLMLIRVLGLLIRGQHAELDRLLGVSAEEEEAAVLVKELKELR